MFTLNNFYQSKQWCMLLVHIKYERLNDEGMLICEHCGKPIVKAYDCIGHHMIELTEENVNDAEIALNSNNIMLVHHKCHNIIHNKLAYGEWKRKVYLVYGAPLSGKSTWVNSVKNDGDLIIDMDNIWQCISGCDRHIKPKRLNQCVFGVRDYLLDCVKYRRGKWLNAYIIGGYPLISERERLCKILGAEEVFIDCSKDECLTRLNNDYPKEYEGYIENWFRQYTPPIL